MLIRDYIKNLLTFAKGDDLFRYFAIILLVAGIVFSNNTALAEMYPDPDDVHLNKLNFCRISKRTVNNYEPEEFSKSNNLLRMAGQKAVFCGERIVVYGKVLDQNCVPVPDAKVYAWQVGCDAKYPYKPLKTVTDPAFYDETIGMTFIGHGTATTNNKGEFTFVTVYPKGAHELGPHINVRVEHRTIGSIQTILDLYGKRVANPSINPDLVNVAAAAKEAGSAIYDFEIVIPGEGITYY